MPGTSRSPLVDFGLREDDRDPVTATQVAQLAGARATWPLAVAVQFLAAAVVAGVTAASGTGLAIMRLAPLAAPLVCTLPLWAVLARTRGWPIHRRYRALLPLAIALAAALAAMLWPALSLPAGPLRLAAATSVAGAIGVSALLLCSARIAVVGFGAGLLAGMAVVTQSVPVAGAMLPVLLCLALAMHRLARRDARFALKQAGQASEGQFAARMIAEFEGQGTGWFWESDRAGRVTYLSGKVAAELARTTGGDPVGQPLTELFRIDSDAPATERTLAFHLSSRTSFSDYSVLAAAGSGAGSDSPRCWSISGRPVTDELGRFQGFIGSGSDLTEKRRSEAEITRLALFDGLTGLANRQRMRLSLDKTLAQVAGPYRATTLFMMDLDRFKAVNDTLGHQAGDELLRQVAQRLQRCVGDKGLCGRLGGDEFQVLLPGTDAREVLAELARTIIAALSQPYYIAGQSVTIGCSIGIAVAPRHDADAETLIRNADLALYAAKGDGRGVHRFYAEDMLAGAQSRKLLEDDLRQAVATGAFHLAYQPVVATADARIVGYEALLRWDHPTRGLVGPATFIPVAEECGLIGAIGEWVMRTACAEAATWPGGVRVAVNVSPIQFASPALPALVASALASAQLDPARLELEITEGVFLDQTRSSDAMFAALKGLGVRLSLDDFGTGYSSLGYLRTAPFDKIKIDQSFVRGAAQPGNRNAAIIKAIIALADTLGMETTAEGVEIQDEIELVRQLGCSHIQGYVYGKPMVGEDARRQLLAAGGHADASGFKVSRSPRTTMLRSARLELGDARKDVRIRNISSSGAMVDGLDVGALDLANRPAGVDVLIELLEDQMFAATLRWVDGGRAGIEFAQQFNLDRLHLPRQQRRSAA